MGVAFTVLTVLITGGMSHTHTYSHLHTHIHSHIHTHTHTYTHTHTLTLTHTHTHTHTHKQSTKHKSVHILTHSSQMPVYYKLSGQEAGGQITLNSQTRAKQHQNIPGEFSIPFPIGQGTLCFDWSILRKGYSCFCDVDFFIAMCFLVTLLHIPSHPHASHTPPHVTIHLKALNETNLMIPITPHTLTLHTPSQVL